MLVVTLQGSGIMLSTMMNLIPQADMVMKLFVDDRQPDVSDTLGTYTEPSGSGYAAKPLQGSRWVLSPGDPAHPATVAYPIQTYDFTGAAGKIFGYYVIQPTAGVLMWAERFTNGPFTVTRNGDKVRVVPQLQLGSSS